MEDITEVALVIVDQPPSTRPSAPESGWEVLDAVRGFLAGLVSYPSEHALNAHTLWIAHTWFMEYWDTTPRLAFLSPEPGSGKSRALEVSEPLVPSPIFTPNISASYLFRRLGTVDEGDPLPTLLYDEVDTVFGRTGDNEDIRALINSGYRRGATVGRNEVQGKRFTPTDFPVFGAVALAGLHDLPDTIATRSIIIRMRRRKAGEVIGQWRSRRAGEIRETLGARLRGWADSVEDVPLPELPEGVTDRNADVWEPIIAIGTLAGGDWPDRATATALAFVADASATQYKTQGVQLLQDLREVFAGHDWLGSTALANSLANMDEGPWRDFNRGKPLSTQRLASMLKEYGIKPVQARHGGDVGRGYAVADFADAWERYLVPAIAQPPARISGWAVGDPVRHKAFGSGLVVETLGETDSAVVRVDFGEQGVKPLLVRYAELQANADRPLPSL